MFRLVSLFGGGARSVTQPTVQSLQWLQRIEDGLRRSGRGRLRGHILRLAEDTEEDHDVFRTSGLGFKV